MNGAKLPNHRDLYYVLCVETCEGEGTPDNPFRIVKDIYNENMEHLGTLD